MKTPEVETDLETEEEERPIAIVAMGNPLLDMSISVQDVSLVIVL